MLFTTGFAFARKFLKKRTATSGSVPATVDASQTTRPSYRDQAVQTEEPNQAVEDDNLFSEEEPAHSDLSPDAETDEQAVRDQNYIAFEEVAEEDFTAGPARFINSSDGVKECVALLATSDLTAKIQNAIEARRNYEREEQIANDQQTALMNLQSNIECEISGHECRISELTESGGDDEAVQTLQQELGNLRLMLEEVQGRCNDVEAQMMTQTLILRNNQTSALQILEEAFIASSLAEPPADEPDRPEQHPLNLQDEYQAFCQRQQQETEDVEPQNIAPLEVTPDEYFQSNNDHLSPEELLSYEITDGYHAARNQLNDTQARFDRREHDREMERRTTGDTEDFDIRWVHRFRELTTELIEAEAAFTAAKAAALEARVDLKDEDQGSMFLDHEDDGYNLSHENDCAASVDSQRIQQWRESIPGDAYPGDAGPDDTASVEVDEWDFRELNWSDSASCVDFGPFRSKIDQMRH